MAQIVMDDVERQLFARGGIAQKRNAPLVGIDDGDAAGEIARVARSARPSRPIAIDTESSSPSSSTRLPSSAPFCSINSARRIAVSGMQGAWSSVTSTDGALVMISASRSTSALRESGMTMPCPAQTAQVMSSCVVRMPRSRSTNSRPSPVSDSPCLRSSSPAFSSSRRTALATGSGSRASRAASCRRSEPAR